jgi:aspartate/methionine/tyrosine aminotransferase
MATAAPHRTTRPVIDLSGTDLGLPTPLHVREAAKRALDAGATHYTTRPGLDALRQAVAEKLRARNGINVDPAREVLITCGTQEALFVALHAVLRPGDSVLVPQPANPAYAAIARQARARIQSVPGAPAAGFALDAGTLERHATRRTRAIILASPATPSGAVLDAATMERIAALAQGRDLVVIVDESNEPFVYADAAQRSLGALPGMADRTLTINGFSRPYAMHGWRIGYIAGPARLLGPIQQLKQALSICSPAVSQHAALAALTGPQAIVEEAHGLVAERRQAAFTMLTECGIPHLRPAAGYELLLDGHGAGRTGAALARWVERGSEVRLGSGATYGAVTTGWLCLSLTRPAPVLAEAIQRLEPLLAARP